MRSWLTAPPPLFWEICLPALLAGGWAAQYPIFGTAGLLLSITAAWPFLRRDGNWKFWAARLAGMVVVFLFGLALTVHSLNRPMPQLPEYVLDRSGRNITAVIKEITAMPLRAPPAAESAKAAAEQEEADAPTSGKEAPPVYRLLLTEVVVFPEDGPSVKLPGDLLWTWTVPAPDESGGEAFRPPLVGQSVRAHLRIREMRGFYNPGVNDSADRHRLEGTLFRAYSQNGKDEAAFSGDPAWGEQTRQALYARFMAALGEPRAPDAPGRAVLPVLLFGDRSYLTDEQTDLFARASLSHSLALSGLHLGFMAGMGWFAARALCLIFPGLMLLMPRGKWAVACGAPLVIVYLWLGGLSPSLLRAALMFACWGAFVLLNRPHPLLDGLCSAVLLLFLVHPPIIFDLRLQLSALCVLAIGLALPAVTRLSLRLAPADRARVGSAAASGSRRRLFIQARGRTLLRGAFSLVCISAAIQVVLTPIQAYVFNQATPWFVLNLLWLPILSAWVFPWAMLGLALCAVPGLLIPASWALSLAAYPASLFFKLLGGMEAAHLLIAPLVARPHSVSIFGYAILATALFICLRHLDYSRMFPEKRRKSLLHVRILLLAGLLCLSFGLWERYDQEHPPGLRVRVLDVGHGLSLLLEGDGGRRMLVDGGGSALSAFNVGEYVLIPLLTANRPPHLTAVVNTHPDADHLRGLFPILQRMEVDEFWLTRPPRSDVEQRLLSAALTEAELAPRQLETGQQIELDDAHYLKILYPPLAKRGGANELSLAAQVVYAPQERGLFLITGDLTKSGAREIMKEAKTAASGAGLCSDVVQVPHHGSKNSLVKGFYGQAAPQVAVVSTGYANQWGFPSGPVREALESAGIPLLDTGTCGQIILRWNDRGDLLEPECARAQNPDD